jgi:hypothetical protein
LNHVEPLGLYTWGILLPRRDCSEFLLSTDGSRYVLPKVAIQRWGRIAPNVNAEIKRQWHLDVISLGELCPPSALNPTHRYNYSLVEALEPNTSPPSGLYWTPVASFQEGSFAHPEEFRVIQQFLSESGGDLQFRLTGAFQRPGWFKELSGWVEEAIRPLGLHLTGRFLQLNASCSFSLIRFETDGGAVWFKAVGEPNLRELRISVALERFFPGYLPPIVATLPAWNGWLTTEVDGSVLDENSHLSSWKLLAQSLANLQILSLGKTKALLEVGCRNLSASLLLQDLAPFLEVMSDLMGRQSSGHARVLCPKEILELGSQIEGLLLNLDTLQLPPALFSLDCNLGNFLVTPTQCIFLDWAEASLGLPTIAFQYLLENLRRMRPNEHAWESALIDCYAKQWEPFLSPERLSEALALAPLVAVFAYAIAGNTWRNPETLENPRTAGYFRSLTRRMKREADGLEAERIVCHN